MWPITVYPDVYCQTKSYSFSKENNKGILFNRGSNILSQRMNIFFAILFYSFYFFLSGSNWYECTRKFGNSYENKNSFIYKKSVKILSIQWWSITRFSLHYLHRWTSVTSWIHKIKNDKRVTKSQGAQVYTFISLKLKGDIFLIHVI